MTSEERAAAGTPLSPKALDQPLSLRTEHETFVRRDGARESRIFAHVFSAGQLIAGRFRVARFIAAGGMGQVYEAYDERLATSVALKTLHPALTRDIEALERFKREIQVAREVSHENLCRVFDLIEHSETPAKVVPCLTMELLKGETLDSYIVRKRPLPSREALPIIQQVAKAIEALHEHGVVHRDLKPSNIVLMQRPSGVLRVVVTDFGLAKQGADPAKLLFESRGEMSVGTPFFMAPELWNGVRPTQSSDIYALGLIIDEMVTISSAFNAASAPTLYFSKVREGPVAPSKRSPDLAPNWESTILRCLDQEPRNRFHNIAEVMAGLQSPADNQVAAPTLPSRSGAPRRKGFATLPKIAVLPFADLSPERDQAYLCDGLTEEVIHLLGQIDTLRVVERASVFELRQAENPLSDIAAKLDVNFVLQGSIRKAGDRIRFTARLVNAADSCAVWSRRYDRQLIDVFAIQDEVAAAIVEMLKSETPLESKVLPAASRTDSMEAHNAYLRGLYEFHKHTAGGLERAVASFRRAIAADCSFAPAHSGLADCYCSMEWYGILSPAEAMPQAKSSALRALSCDVNSASARCTLAIIKARYEWDWKGAEEEFQTARSMNPGAARALFSHALDYLTPMGRLDEALQTIEFALQLDPLSPILQTAIGGCYYRKRMYKVAVQSLEHNLQMKPGFNHTYWSLARAYEQLGRHSDARKAYETALDGSERNPMILGEWGHCLGVMGQAEEAAAVLDELKEAARARYVSPLCAAFVHLGLSQSHEAIRCLQRAAAERSGAIIWVGVDPRFDALRGHSAFKEILSAAGLFE